MYHLLSYPSLLFPLLEIPLPLILEDFSCFLSSATLLLPQPLWVVIFDWSLAVRAGTICVFCYRMRAFGIYACEWNEPMQLVLSLNQI